MTTERKPTFQTTSSGETESLSAPNASSKPHLGLGFKTALGEVIEFDGPDRAVNTTTGEWTAAQNGGTLRIDASSGKVVEHPSK
jgi:hypothetical protein